MTAPTIDVTSAIAALEASGQFRVLRRFEPRLRYNDEPWNVGESPLARLGVYVDVETTGLDVETDEIIELSLVPFSYDVQLGIVFDVRAPISFLEEPRGVVSKEITELTGISHDMLKGQRINDALVEDVARGASLVIAHNADFDRRMLERRLPAFAEVAWACSQREVPWQDFGVRGAALPNILMSACREFTDAEHRAAIDCQVGVHCLAAPTLDGRTALSYLLESARAGAHRVCAISAPMQAKNLLKARKYSAPYVGGRFQYWYKDVPGTEAGAELEWCQQEARAIPVLTKISARDRYSVRADR